MPFPIDVPDWDVPLDDEVTRTEPEVVFVRRDWVPNPIGVLQDVRDLSPDVLEMAADLMKQCLDQRMVRELAVFAAVTTVPPPAIPIALMGPEEATRPALKESS